MIGFGSKWGGNPIFVPMNESQRPVLKIKKRHFVFAESQPIWAYGFPSRERKFIHRI
jgi:hypothetical protein